MPLTLAYTVLDVFAEHPLEGNPLAVFHDARGLTDEQLQALARETNLSETAFVFPAADPEQERTEGVRVRIFTTEEELPFAGHPTLGTASWLWLNHPTLKGAETITLQLNVGPIVVRFTQGNNGVFATMQQNDAVFGAEHDAAEIAAVIGMTIDDLLPGYAPQTVSTGNAFCIVALCSVQALSSLAIPQREATAWLSANSTRWFYCIAQAGDGTWRARMQWYNGEDPATGSAAGPCIAWLVRHGLAVSQQPVVIGQGTRCFGPAVSPPRRSCSKTRCVPSWFRGAPFLWQRDAFSCLDLCCFAQVMNHKRQQGQAMCADGGYAIAKWVDFRRKFTVATAGSPPYAQQIDPENKSQDASPGRKFFA